MRRTYKLASRQNKQTKTYRRKTLDPKTKLNIIKDDDDLENIDDYWKTAESVLKDDDTIEIGETSIYKSDPGDNSSGNEDRDSRQASTQSDTLFDIKSIKESLSAKPKISLDSSKISLRNRSISEGQLSSLFNDGESGFNDAYSFNDVSDEIHNDSEFTDNEGRSRISNEPQIGHRTQEIYEEEPKQKNMSKGKKAIGNRSKKNRKGEQSGITRKRLQSVGSQSKAYAMRDISPESRAVYEYKGETLYDSMGREIAATDISGLYKGRSIFEPLVASRRLETAVLFLNNLAFIKPEKATCSFSVFMIKGTVCVEMDQDKIMLKRGSVCIIEKDTTYSINNSSGTRCTILLTYSIA